MWMFITQLETATDQDNIIFLLRSLSQKIGFTQFRMMFICPSSIQRPEVCIFNGCSLEWARKYEKRHFFGIDPVVRKGMAQSTPILWAHVIEKCRAEQDKAGLEVMLQAQEAGLQDGITFPWHGVHGHVGLLSWITSSTHTEHQWLKIAPFLHWLAVHFFESFSRGGLYKRSSHDVLSLREIEVCQWAAEGKQVSDIAKILDITPRTVTFHLNRVIDKLGASSKGQAISWAIKKGLIRLNIAAARIENIDNHRGHT